MDDPQPGIPPDLFNQWVSEPETVCRDEFQEIVRISLQKVADIAERARRYGARTEFEKLHKWLKNNDEAALASRLIYNEGQEHFSPKERALEALNSQQWGPEQSQIIKNALHTIPD